MNREKIVITKDNYSKIMLKRAIILCWVLLAICFVMKLFGSNLFNIVIENQKFNSFCVYVDTNFLPLFIISVVYNVVLGTLMVLAMDSELKPTKFKIIYNLIVGIVCFLIKYFCPKLELVAGVIQLVSLVLITKRKGNGLVMMLYYIAFSLISQFVKGTDFNLTQQSIVFSLILSIDVIIMMVLLYLYSYKTKGGIMGFLFAFLSNDITQLKAYRDTLKDPKKIAKVDAKIAKLEKKNKEEE